MTRLATRRNRAGSRIKCEWRQHTSLGRELGRRWRERRFLQTAQVHTTSLLSFNKTSPSQSLTSMLTGRKWRKLRALNRRGACESWHKENTLGGANLYRRSGFEWLLRDEWFETQKDWIDVLPCGIWNMNVRYIRLLLMTTIHHDKNIVLIDIDNPFCRWIKYHVNLWLLTFFPT